MTIAADRAERQPENHYAPPLRVLRSVLFNHELALFYNGLGLSGDGTVDWILTEIFDHRKGELYGYDAYGKLSETALPLGTPELTDDLFGEDACRFINRHRARARQGFRNRLKMSAVFPVLMMHFAREIYLRRTKAGESNDQ